MLLITWFIRGLSDGRIQGVHARVKIARRMDGCNRGALCSILIEDIEQDRKKKRRNK